MTRTEVLQEFRLVKFDDTYSLRAAGKLTQVQASEMLGVSVRTVRRWEERFEADVVEGLYDRHLGKMTNNRVPTDAAMKLDFVHYSGKQSVYSNRLNSSFGVL